MKCFTKSFFSGLAISHRAYCRHRRTFLGPHLRHIRMSARFTKKKKDAFLHVLQETFSLWSSLHYQSAFTSCKYSLKYLQYFATRTPGSSLLQVTAKASFFFYYLFSFPICLFHLSMVLIYNLPSPFVYLSFVFLYD